MIPGLLAAIAVFSYLLGGLNGAIIASKYVFHRDVRDYGSGNAGLTNFYRTFGACGKLPALLSLFCVILLVVKHRSNIGRLIRHKESKLSFKKDLSDKFDDEDF